MLLTMHLIPHLITFQTKQHLPKVPTKVPTKIPAKAPTKLPAKVPTKVPTKIPEMFQTATIPPTAQIDNKSAALQALELLTVVNQADLSTSYTR